jgi:putative transposase
MPVYPGAHNQHRPHRSLSLHPPDQPPVVLVRAPEIHIHKHEVLGGLINEYKAAA